MQSAVVAIEHVERRRCESFYLAAQFRTDRTPRPRDQHPPPREECRHCREVDLYRVPTEKVQLRHGTDVAGGQRAEEFLDRRKQEYVERGVAAEFCQLAKGVARRARDGDQDRLGPCLLGNLADVVATSHHLHVADLEATSGRIVVEQRHWCERTRR